jgi:hypothetical protein
MQEVQGLAYWFKRLVSQLKALQNYSSNAESSVRAKDPRPVKRIKCQARNTCTRANLSSRLSVSPSQTATSGVLRIDRVSVATRRYLLGPTGAYCDVSESMVAYLYAS